MNLKYLFWFCFWLAVAFICYKVNGYYQKFKFYCRQLKLATTEMRKHVDEITAILKSLYLIITSESLKLRSMFAFKFEPTETVAVSYAPVESTEQFPEVRELQRQVSGIAGFGLSEYNTMTVYVENLETGKHIPKTLDGRQVRIEVTGEIHAQRLA